MEQVAHEYEGRLKVVGADVEVAGDTAAGLGIMGIPTVVFYKDGQEVHRIVGAVPKPKIVEAIKKTLGI
jgi:thioredoxin 1